MNTNARHSHQPWNKGKLVGQKAPLRVRDIWAIRVRLQLAEKTRDLALFNLAIDSKLRACDLTKLRVRDIAHGEHVSSRAIVMQQKTQHPVQFEITEQTRTVLEAWMHQAHLRSEDFLFPTRLHSSDHLSTRQYARIVKAWVTAIGLDPTMYLLTVFCLMRRAALGRIATVWRRPSQWMVKLLSALPFPGHHQSRCPST
jgi:integrase